MIPATDGNRPSSANGPRMRPLRSRRFTKPGVLLGLLCAIAAGHNIGDASSPSGASPLAWVPAATVLANQAVSLEADAPPGTVSSPRMTVGANRPRALTDDAESPEADGEENTTDQAGLWWRTPQAPNPAIARGDVILARADQPLTSEVKGQPPEPAAVPPKLPPEDTLISAVQVEGEAARCILIAKDSAATIDLKVPVDRVEVRDPTIADVARPTPRRILIVGKNFGTTQVVLSAGAQQQVVTVNVEMNLALLREIIKSVAPTADVQAQSIRGTILLRGNVPDGETAEQIEQLAVLMQGGEVRNQLKVAGVQQTMLRVVVAEVNRQAIRDLGVNWAIGGSDWSRDIFFANNLTQLNPTTFTSSGVPNVLLGNHQGGQLNYSLAAVGNGAATNVTFGFPRAEFQMFMHALRENDLSRTLAEPNLVAISGQTATFLAGGEVPVPVAQGGAAAGAITIEYHEFGVRLGFTPTVVAGQIIRLHVMTEVSEAVPTQQLAGGFPLYTFNTRRVESTIECGNGQSFAIAGLLNDTVRAVSSKIPGLGDIPVLGALFSSTNYQKSNTELIVFVTPELVEPLDPQQVPTPPGGLMTEPNDFELFALQKLEGAPSSIPESDGVPREHVPANVRPGEATSWSGSQLTLRGPWGFADNGDTY